MGIIKLKLRAGKYRLPVVINQEGGRLFLQFRYNVILKDEVRLMEGARWHGYDEENPRKIWSIKDSQRNWFQLDYLAGKDPYAPYDAEIIKHKYSRPLMDHQKEMADFALTRRKCELACEMGTGKTLAAIEVMERSGHTDWYWIGPKSALAAVDLEFSKWKSKIYPTMMTYEGLTKVINNWEKGEKAPFGVIFDESSKVKTPTSQRSQAAKELADGIRTDHGADGIIVLMTGTPAPKAPTDWFWQLEIACPGFIKEGTLSKFKTRLSIIKMMPSITGQEFPKLLAWRDDDKRCEECGQFEDSPEHQAVHPDFHDYSPCKNEVKFLYQRMSGLVIVKNKDECLDLPDKVYRKITCEVKPSTRRSAKLIVAQSPKVIQALTLLRELSDGFQYREEVIGSVTCDRCFGEKTVIEKVPVGAGEDGTVIINSNADIKYENMELACPRCNGTGIRDKKQRTIAEVASPKEEVLKGLLDEHDDYGRIVIYGGFTGSVDKCVRICHSEGWGTIRVDGRGWEGTTYKGELFDGDFSNPDYLQIFQEEFTKYPRLAFVGQPGAAGMGLTLTASPSIVFYSNDFNGESRIQAEDRIHRPGCRGANIIDILHLDTDSMILENLMNKKKLQDISTGQLSQFMSKEE